MKLALELPTAYLGYFSELTDFDFALAQVVLEDETYATFMRKQAESRRTVILDNGFHEMGRPLSIPELERACDLVKPTFVISPDWIGRPVETYEAFEAFSKRVPKEHLAVVLSGRDASERAQYFSNVHQRVSMLCLPYREPRRVWMEELIGSYSQPYAWPPNIHLLGMSDFEEAFWWKRFEQRAYRIFPRGFSIDTAKPVKWGLEGKLMHYDQSPRKSPVSSATLHEVKDIRPDHMEAILRNIAYLRRFV